MDGIIFTHYRRSPSTKRVNSTRSAARNQLFPEAKMQTGSSAARSVQLSGISHWRPFLSRKQTLCSPLYSLDRKSTRLNSSHVAISYAVFCLKKKNKKTIERI